MFDSKCTVTNNIKINACSGGIYKSHPKSRIVNMKMESGLADKMLTTKQPKIEEKDIVVLQVINSFDGYILVEYMYKEDYEKENVYNKHE